MKHRMTMMAGCVVVLVALGVILAAGGPRWLAYLFVLACPVMMILMHGMHGDRHEQQEMAERDRQRDPTAS
jgi:hypothetical protein